MTGQVDLPLSGIRVLDFSHVLAGPVCTRALADLGAEVLRVESSHRAVTPWSSPYDPILGRHLAYVLVHRGKKSITLNLKSPAGGEIARRLASVADVVVENFSAGVMKRLALDHDRLAALNERLVYLSMSGYGHNGPRQHWTSMNSNLQAYSGVMMLTAPEDQPPVAISSSWMDYIGGLHGCFAVLDALGERAKTGKGRNIDLSQFECGVGTIGSFMIAAIANGSLPLRLGNRSTSVSPQGCYRCAGEDDWCVISVENEDQWVAFVGALGNPDWGQEPSLRLLTERCRRREEIDSSISNWTRTKTPAEVETVLRQAGVAAERMRRMDEVDREGKDSVFHRVSGGTEPVLLSGLPFSFQPRGEVEFGPAPRLGEHTDIALTDWLGMEPSEIADLRSAGALT